MSDGMRIALVVAIWGAASLVVTGVVTGVVRNDTQETLRLLKRGDKVDCRMSDMKGTLP